MEAGALREHLVDAGPIVDSLVNQYGRILEDSRAWREQVSLDGICVALDNGVLQAHPLIDRILKAEWTVLNSLRSIQRVLDMQKLKRDEDDFDAFLIGLTASRD